MPSFQQSKSKPIVDTTSPTLSTDLALEYNPLNQTFKAVRPLPTGGTGSTVIVPKINGLNDSQFSLTSSNLNLQTMVGASQSTASKVGLVPVASVGSQNKQLQADGTWVDNDFINKVKSDKWKSVTSAYTFDFVGTPFANGSDIDSYTPTYLKPQWYHVDLLGNIIEDAGGGNLKNATNLAKINSSCELGAMPMVKGDFYDSVSGTVKRTWADGINTSTKRTNQVNSLVNFIISNDYLGIEIDYEPTSIDMTNLAGQVITMTDMDNKYAFLTQLSNAVHALPPKVINGASYTRKVSTAIVAQVNNSGTYNLIDPVAMNNTGVDYIMVMNYDWHYPTYTSSITPIQQFTEACEWAVKCIDLEKIVMGINDYGYSGQYNSPITESGFIRRQQAQSQPNFINAQRNSLFRVISGNTFRGGDDLYWLDGLNVSHLPDSRTHNSKRRISENFGIRQVSMWALTGTPSLKTFWFNGRTEPKYLDVLFK